MSHSQRSLLTVRSGILVFILMSLASIHIPLRQLPDVDLAQLVLLLALGILPAAALFIAIGLQADGEDHEPTLLGVATHPNN